MDNQTANDKRAKEAKRPYAKPQIQEVPLRPDEAVLAACKTASTSGATQATCSVPSNCFSQNS